MEVVTLFATFLAGSLQQSTIKIYLSAVRSLHIKSVFQILFLIAYSYSEWFRELSALRAPLDTHAHQSHMSL